MSGKGRVLRRDRSTTTKADLIRFVEWVVERAGEEVRGGSQQGPVRSLLEAVEHDGRALLRKVRP